MTTSRNTVILIPTELERDVLLEGGPLPAHIELCGFGVAVAGVRAAEVISERRPTRVLLVGLAGSYDESRAPIGSAHVPHWVEIDGIGVIEGKGCRPPSAMGFHQWPGDSQSSPIDERIPLTIPHSDGEVGLLTVCAASPDWVHAQRRAQKSGAVLEDMEAFSVAVACALREVPLVVVRGVSNLAGDRDRTHWSISDAMSSVRERLEFLLHPEETT